MSSHRSTSRQPSDCRRLESAFTPSLPAEGWASGGERRVARRVHLRAPLAVRWAGHSETVRIRILDLSRSGFCFECHKVYSLEDHGHAESIKPEGTHIGSDFVIVWAREVKPGTYQYGTRFVKHAAARRSA
jgi:hypothetical protein